MKIGSSSYGRCRWETFVRGRRRQKLLKPYGVETIGQLAACRPDTLETLLGKMGLQLHAYANGLDRSSVRSRFDAEPAKSVGNGTHFLKI